jgi:hypothetical protein
VLLNYGFADGAGNYYVEMFATLDVFFLKTFRRPNLRLKIEGTSIEELAKTWATVYRSALPTECTVRSP